MTSPAMIHRYTPGTRKTIPDYEVAAFFDEVAPGLKQVQIAEILGVQRNAVGQWLKNGMPSSKARELLAWRHLEICRLSARVTEIAKQFEL